MRYHHFSHRPTTHRKRRVRKKWRIGEFTEYGFDVEARFTDGLDYGGQQLVWNDFVDHLDRMALVCGGGGNGKAIYMFVSETNDHTSVTETHRVAVSEWLSSRREIATMTIGPLVDSWR